jgi:purine-cytosine permease-like protein
MKKTVKLDEYFNLLVVIAGVIAVAISIYSLVSDFTFNGNFEQFMNTLRVVMYSFITLMSFRIYRRLRNQRKHAKVYKFQRENE